MLFAGQHGEPLQFDADARAMWIAVYDDLSDGRPGLWGAASARAEAHAVRLAMLYALLECSPAIRAEHLDAALAFWHYASESAHWVFGDSLGDPTADEIWEMAKTNPERVTRTQVSDLFSREGPRDRAGADRPGRGRAPRARGNAQRRRRQTGRRLAPHLRRASRLSRTSTSGRRRRRGGLMDLQPRRCWCVNPLAVRGMMRQAVPLLIGYRSIFRRGSSRT
jgi:hypothetical protein